MDLDKPDKVVLIEVYQVRLLQSWCLFSEAVTNNARQNAVGMSVVDGDYWNELKRYNLTELYSHASKQGREEAKPSVDEGAKPSDAEDKS